MLRPADPVPDAATSFPSQVPSGGRDLPSPFVGGSSKITPAIAPIIEERIAPERVTPGRTSPEWVPPERIGRRDHHDRRGNNDRRRNDNRRWNDDRRRDNGRWRRIETARHAQRDILQRAGNPREELGRGQAVIQG